MPDPTEIAVISSVLPATFSFLFQRLEHLLSSRGSEPEGDIALPDGLVGALDMPLQPAQNQLQTRRGELEVLRDALAIYARGEAPARTSDQALLRNLTRLRGALEDIYGQHLTFDGEDRPASGPFVHQKLTTVAGEATGMDAEEIAGSTRVVQDVSTVDSGGTLTGMKARRIDTQ